MSCLVNKSLFEFDKKFLNENIKYILGTDEAGRGPGAGDVYASCVCFKSSFFSADKNLLEKLNDSKKLTEKIREELFNIIIENSFYSIKTASVEEIEKYNILNASLLAMKRACLDVLDQLKTHYKFKENESIILIDGNKLIKEFNINQKYVIKGDSHSATIAAASILAKVKRDHYMKTLHIEYPYYKWDNNKGYLTKEHLNAIDNYGVSKFHRRKFLEKHFLKKELKIKGNL